VNVGQQARADRIRQMFDQVAARYDARNRLFSADRDRAWRRRAARRAALYPGQTALDLCTGTGKLAHQNPPRVPNRLRRDVLVSADILLHRVHVHAALMRKCTGADIRLARNQIHIGDFIHIPAHFRQMLNRPRPQTV